MVEQEVELKKKKISWNLDLSQSPEEHCSWIADLSTMRQKGKAILPLPQPLTECVLLLERGYSIREGRNLWQKVVAGKGLSYEWTGLIRAHPSLVCWRLSCISVPGSRGDETTLSLKGEAGQGRTPQRPLHLLHPQSEMRP